MTNVGGLLLKLVYIQDRELASRKCSHINIKICIICSTPNPMFNQCTIGIVSQQGTDRNEEIM